MSIEKLSDTRTSVNPPDDIDAHPLLGTWSNTSSASRQIAGVRIEVVDGRPMLHVWGASRPSCRDWGTVPIGRLYRGSPGLPQAAAFEARFDFGPMTALLEVNLSKGLLIIACMKSFRDGSGRSSYFVREFFRRTDSPSTPRLVPAELGPRPVTCAEDEVTPNRVSASPPRLDPGLFLGRWVNTDAGTRGVREVRMSDRDGGLLLELHDAEDRSESVAELFAEHPAGTVATQFHAAIDRAGRGMLVHGWVKLGVLVIAVFRDRAGSTAPTPCFDRDFFYQADRP